MIIIISFIAKENGVFYL